MKFLKLFALLVMFVGVLTLAQEPICAFGPCQDACQGQLNSCSTSSQQQYDWCYSTITNNLDGCLQDADSQHQICYQICGHRIACEFACDQQRDSAQALCYDNYFNAQSQCDLAQTQRDAQCQSDYTTCIGSCP